MTDILVQGGRVVDPGSGVDAELDLLIVDGRVAQLGSGLGSNNGAQVVDASGLVVAPGFIDLHVHLREPGQEHKETIESGARAAARGGFTTICAMPNTEPAMDSAAIIDGVLQRANGVDCRVLPIGAVSKGRKGRELTELAALRDAGAVAVSDDGDAVADTGLARRAFEYLADIGIPLAEHCEDPAISQGGVMHDGAVSTRLGLQGQPAAAELSIVQRDIALAEASGAQFHGCHVSTEPALQAIADAKARGLAVTAEVTPHHLCLTHDAVAGSGEELRYNTNAKVNPPLRTEADVQACIDALAAGVVDAVATDHAPHAAVDKCCEFDRAAFGISGLESAWAVVNSLVDAGRLTLPEAIARLTVGPVRAWNLDRAELSGLGTLQVGAPADVVVLDTTAATSIEPQSWASMGKNTPLAGRRMVGVVAATISQGRIVWDSREQVEQR